MVTQEGTRPLLVEIQALVDSGAYAEFASPLRRPGPQNRLAMLLAVLASPCRRGPVSIRTFSSMPSVACKITEPAADLAVLLAIQGSLRGKALPRGFIAFGEVGLAGEVRPAPRGQERLKEAAKLGFSVAVVPRANAPKKAIEGLTIHAVDRIEQAIDVVRSLA